LLRRNGLILGGFHWHLHLKRCSIGKQYVALKGNDFLSEIPKKIKECVSEIESYSYDAPDLTVPAVNSLKDCEKLLDTVTEENREKALKIISRLYQQALAYAEYVPTSVKNLKYIKEWLEQATK
jgi:hypothetical protein